MGDKTRYFLEAFSPGLLSLERGGSLGKALLYTVLVWASIVAMSVIFLPAVGLPPGIFLGTMFTVGACVALAVPAAPGFIGTFQAWAALALRFGGALQDAAAA